MQRSAPICDPVTVNIMLRIKLMLKSTTVSQMHLFRAGKSLTTLKGLQNLVSKPPDLKWLPERGGRHIPWVESKTCFQPYEANPRRGVRTV